MDKFVRGEDFPPNSFALWPCDQMGVQQLTPQPVGSSFLKGGGIFLVGREPPILLFLAPHNFQFAAIAT